MLSTKLIRNVFLDDTLKEDCTRLSAYLSRLSLEERLRCIGLLIIRAVRSLGDKKLLLSISPPFIADIIEEARKVSLKAPQKPIASC